MKSNGKDDGRRGEKDEALGYKEQTTEYEQYETPNSNGFQSL